MTDINIRDVVLERDGMLQVDGLPFRAGDRVKVVVMRPANGKTPFMPTRCAACRSATRVHLNQRSTQVSGRPFDCDRPCDGGMACSGIEISWRGRSRSNAPNLHRFK